MLFILGCLQSLFIFGTFIQMCTFGTFIQMFTFGAFIQLQMIFPLCLVFVSRCLRLHVNNNLGSSLPVIHTLHMKQEHNINMRNIFVFECLYVFMCAGSTAPTAVALVVRWPLTPLPLRDNPAVVLLPEA